MSGSYDAAAFEDPATIVVDFGTGSVRAAVVAGGTSWLVPEPVTGSACWPAAAHWDGEQLLVGALAERARVAEPDGYWSELKGCLTLDAAVSQGGRTFRPVELVTAVLRAVAAAARRRPGPPIDRALLTVPAGYQPGGRQRQAMIAAAEAAGLGTVELLSEPVAAVSASTFAAGALVLVCDLGAGSFDCALVRLGDEPEVVGADTLDGAGRDIDALLERHIHTDGRAWLAPLLAEAEQHPGAPSAVRLGMALGDFARRVKHRLSEEPVVQDMMLPTTAPYRLTQDDLARVVAPLLDRAVARADDMLRRLDASTAELDGVLLAGGAAHMPVVARRLARAFGRTPYQFTEPELAVVHGAVRWLARRGRPAVTPEQLAAGTTPLAFAIPGGNGELVRWLVGPGQRYGSGATLARVRLPGGALWDLTAASPGVLDRVLVGPDTEVSAHQWLALATP